MKLKTKAGPADRASRFEKGRLPVKNDFAFRNILINLHHRHQVRKAAPQQKHRSFFHRFC